MIIQTEDGHQMELPDGTPPSGIDDALSHFQSTQQTSTSSIWHNAGSDEPGYTYGSVLPFKKNQQTGEVSAALPEMIKSPLRGIGDMYESAENRSTDMTPDAVNAMLAVSGINPALRGASAAIPATAEEATEAAIPKTPAYDADTVHAAISDSYGAAKQKVTPYYNLMKDIGSGETANASGLKPQLQSMISDIEITPFHEAVSELPYLRQQAAKIDDNGTMPLNDMVKLKQNLNSNFNPKRFTNATDTPYSNASSIVDNSLDDAAQRIPEFGEAKSLADKNWLNTVKAPFEDNTVLQKFWKPEDYFAKKSVDNGMLEEMPDPSKQRAAQMLGNIDTPVELNAIRRALPSDWSDSLSQAKIQDITQGVGVGRLQAAGKAAYYGATGRFPTALRNAADVINPAYTQAEKELLQAAKSPAPTLSTKYEKPFQTLKAGQQQMSDSASEMQPMQYGPTTPSQDAAASNTAIRNTPFPKDVNAPMTSQLSPQERMQAAGNVYQGAAKRPFKSVTDSPAGDQLRQFSGQPIKSIQDIAPSTFPQSMEREKAVQSNEEVQSLLQQGYSLQQIKQLGYKRGGAIPTPAQIEAGNYKKKHIKFQGLDISIETPKGDIRRGNGWENVSPADYGYIKRTEGADGEHMDCYIGPHEKSNRIYIIDQKHLHGGKFDEHKCMLGFANRDEAVSCYKKGFSDGNGHKRLGKVTRMSMAEFKDWLKSGDTKSPVKQAA